MSFDGRNIDPNPIDGEILDCHSDVICNQNVVAGLQGRLNSMHRVYKTYRKSIRYLWLLWCCWVCIVDFCVVYHSFNNAKLHYQVYTIQMSSLWATSKPRLTFCCQHQQERHDRRLCATNHHGDEFSFFGNLSSMIPWAIPNINPMIFGVYITTSFLATP